MLPEEEETLRLVRSAIEAGMYLKAWRHGQTLGPLASWSGTGGRVLAGRLAMALGAGRLGLALHLRAHRARGGDPEAHYYHARAVLGARGPLAAFRLMRRHALPEPAPVEVRADWLAMQATVATAFRDFDAAEELLARAEALCPGRPWIAVERATVLERQDRLDEALERALAPLRAAPFYRPGVGIVASLLERLGRSDEALTLLEKADAALESASLAAHRALLLLEQERAAEAELVLDRFETLSPLLDAAGRSWLAARRSDAAYLRGDLEAARARAEQAGGGFYDEIARRLAAPLPALRPRRRLAVPFVQQQHLTCSPASIASIAAYWSRPLDQRELAREIAYDGTPGHREREWARANGWVAREFRLTEEACRTLVDAGVPFVMGRQSATSAHAQVVAGMDGCRGTLLVRDPAWPRLTEVLLERLLADQAPFGPRCLALVPAQQAPRIAALTLPDEAGYDAYHALQLRLLAHDREGAQAVHDALDEDERHGRLRLSMEIRLHEYDADLQGVLRGYEELLRRHPETPLFLLRRVELLGELGRGAEAEAELARLSSARGADPVFALRLADTLAADARRAEDVQRLLDRVLRAQPTEAAALASLASLLWSRGEREEALELRRLAACAEIHDEGKVGAYFSAARHLDRAEEALALLRSRVLRLGDRSGAPVRSLFRALEDCGRLAEAFAALDDATRRHPDDGELLLFAAEAEARCGRGARAEELLAASRGHAREPDRLRVEARLRRWAGEAQASLACWRAVARAEPLAIDAHRAIAELLCALEGTEAARRHLEQAAALAPLHEELWHLLVEWLRGDVSRCAAALDTLLARHPQDVWAHREKALLLSREGRHEEAAAALVPALQLAPTDAGTLGVHGHLQLAAGRRGAAAECFRAAVRRLVDYVSGIEGLLEAAETVEERREALRFVAEQLVRQVAGEACFTFQRRARGLLEPAETLALLRRAREARPDRWQPWSAEADELLDQGRLREAAALLQEATARFPLVAPLWLDSARVHELEADPAAAVSALERAAAMAPGWVVPLQRLAEALARAGRHEEAAAAVRRAAAVEPGDAEIAILAGEMQLQSGDRNGAGISLRRAARLDPRADRAWQRLREAEGPEAVAAFARELARERTEDPEALLAAVWRLPPAAVDERLALVERVLAARPLDVHAHDVRAVVLAEAGRIAEALAACEPPALAERPAELLGRHAWVLARCGRRSEAIAAMRAALAQHPDYWWGARRLAEWTSDEGSAGSLDDAERLVRIAPDSSEALRARAEARLRQGDEAGGRADLERALALAPNDAGNTERLFEVLLAQAALDAAAALLDRPHALFDAQQLACWRARLLAARGRKAEACAALASELSRDAPPHPGLDGALEAVTAACGWDALEAALAGVRDRLAPPLVGALVASLAKRGERERAARVLDLVSGRKDALEAACREWLTASGSEPGDRVALEAWRALAPAVPESWMLMAEASCAGDAAARLALVEEALRRRPDHVGARDLRAALLAELRRFGEAAAACEPVAGETTAPFELEGRAAWTSAQAGRVQEARRRMRAVLAEHPDYAWGWRHLLDWDYGRERADLDYLADARRHAELVPAEAVSHGWVGDACRRLGRRAEAEAAFRRSVEIDRDYEWGRLALVDLLLADGRLAEAQAALVDAPLTPASALRGVRVAVARGEGAASALERLLRLDAATDEVLREAREAFAEQPALLRRCLAALLEASDTPPRLGTIWMEWLASRREWRECEAVLARLRGRPALARAALAPLVRAYRGDGQHRRLRRLLRRERDALRADDALWALAGHALSLFDDRAAIEWLVDWPARRATPWLLNALALSLRRTGRGEEALAVSRRALELPPDHVSGCHRVWIGVEAAIAGDGQEASRLLETVDTPEEVRGFYEGLAALGRAVLAMRRASPSSRQEAFGEARRLVAVADRALGRGNRDAARLRRRAVLRIGRLRGGLAGRLWRFVDPS